MRPSPSVFRVATFVGVIASTVMISGSLSAGPLDETFFDRNFQNLPLAPFPGVTVAQLRLPPGTYVMHVKLRYRNTSDTPKTAGCVFQGDGIGGLDSSSSGLVPPTPPGQNGNASQVDGVLMDILEKNTDGEVHVQCFGPPETHIINTQFAAVPATLHIQ
jgi:hypothetical protein